MKTKLRNTSLRRAWPAPAICSIMALSALPSAPAQAGAMLLAPTRLLFEGGSRAQEVTIMNRSDQIQTYRIRLEDRRLKMDGEYDVITDGSDPLAASSMLRLSSRQITIPAQESATVRVLLRKPASLGSGEYRSHLIVQELPAIAPPPASPTEGEGLSIKITTIFGISIPVLVRSGETSVRVSPPKVKRTNVADRPDLQNLEVALESVGNRSTFLDLRVFPVRGRRGSPIAEVKGVAIYAPVHTRNLVVPLNPEQTAQLRSGSFVMTYQEVNKDGTPIGQIQEVGF